MLEMIFIFDKKCGFKNNFYPLNDF